jgi:catechol 2,3-dioxygenase-like lactoylglutathione lyase family enzyme
LSRLAGIGHDASMLQHVSIEVRPEDVEACIAAWGLLGFAPLREPEELRGYVSWVEHKGTQIHLIHTEGAVVPQLGHSAVVVDDFDATFAALEAAGHPVEEARELWGEPRAFVVIPGGHRVELMAAPPPGPS